jgi:hypothetical protein
MNVITARIMGWQTSINQQTRLSSRGSGTMRFAFGLGNQNSPAWPAGPEGVHDCV